MTWWPTPFLCRWIQTAELQNVTNIIMERSVLKNLHIGYIRFLEEQAILPNQVILIKICSTNRKSYLQISDCVIDMIVLVQRDFFEEWKFSSFAADSALLCSVLWWLRSGWPIFGLMRPRRCHPPLATTIMLMFSCWWWFWQCLKYLGKQPARGSGRVAAFWWWKTRKRNGEV